MILSAVASLAFSSPLADPPQIAPHGVDLYADPSYHGNKLTIVDSVNRLTGSSDDSITAVEPYGGAVFELCDDPNYEGECDKYAAANAHIPRDDEASSVNVVGNVYHPYAVLWEHPNFSGRSAVIMTNDGDLRANVPAGNMNDVVSSVQIVNGASISLCTNLDFGGQCMDLTSSVSTLPHWLADKATSVEVTHPHIVLFEHPNFKGGSMLVTESGTVADLNGGEWAWMADAVSSIAVYGGANPWIFERSDVSDIHASGEHYQLTGQMHVRSLSTLDDKVRSILFVP